jgi:hypothetical protein
MNPRQLVKKLSKIASFQISGQPPLLALTYGPRLVCRLVGAPMTTSPQQKATVTHNDPSKQKKRHLKSHIIPHLPHTQPQQAALARN